jgi:CYTH domain-containing protein
MSTEIEQKFLVASRPHDLDQYRSEQIEQGYLAIQPGRAEIRVRRKGDRCFLTVKSGGGRERREHEIELSRDQFETLWPATEGWRLKKTRYAIPCGDRTIELDIYHGRLEGLVTAEVEFETVEQSDAFSPPDWFGREITADLRFKNQSLARKGLPGGEGVTR